MPHIPNSLVIGVGKGGVGKTALATTLAAIWARDGMRILLVDSDAQANATLALGITPEEHGSGRSLTDAVVYREPLQVTAARPNLDVVTAGRHTTHLAQSLVIDPEAPAHFADVFARVADSYDRIVIDIPPAGGSSRIPTIALAVGEYLLVPTSDQFHELEGLRVLGDDLAEVNSDIILLGVVLYRVPLASKRARIDALAEIRAILDGSAEPFDTIIRYAPSAYKQSLQNGVLVHEYLDWAANIALGERIKRKLSIPDNLKNLADEFETLAVEVNDRIAAIEAHTRPQPQPAAQTAAEPPSAS